MAEKGRERRRKEKSLHSYKKRKKDTYNPRFLFQLKKGDGRESNAKKEKEQKKKAKKKTNKTEINKKSEV